MKIKSFICFTSFALALLILASSCSSIIEMDVHPLKYNGEQYCIIHNWEMINRNDYTKDKATWDKKEHQILVYSNLEKRFVFDEYYQLLYHKETDLLPNYNDTQSIKIIEIVFSDVNKAKIVLDDNSIIESAVGLMSQPYNRNLFKNNSPFKKTLAVINVYFNDYPAYQSTVSVLEAIDGSLGFVMNDWNYTEKVNNSDYIVIPSNSKMQSYFK